jgi:anti-anti-sigma regulatory factor
MSRTVGPVSGVGGLGSGDHVCWIYAGDDDYRSGLARYFADGLKSGQRLLYLADRYDEAAVEASLAAAGLAPRRLLDEGRLRIIPAREGYPRNGDGYDLDDAVVQFRGLAGESVAAGYAGLRVAGECGFLLGGDADRIPFLAYELACDMMVRGAPLTAMCLYDAQHDPADRLGEIAAVHAAAIVAASLASSVPTFHLWSKDEDAIGVGGEIDFATSDTIRDVLMSAAVGRADVIDVSRVGFADVSAVRALAKIAEQMAGPQDRRVIRGASPQLRFVAAQFGVEGLLFDG